MEGLGFRVEGPGRVRDLQWAEDILHLARASMWRHT